MATIVIRRQLLEVELDGSEADAHVLHRHLSELCGRVLPSVIEHTLGPFDVDDRHRSIDRLEVDLTGMSLTHLDDDLPEALARGVRSAMQDARFRPGETSPAAGVRHRTRRQAVDAALVAFLRSGRLPWWFDLAPGRTLEDEIADAWDRGDEPRGVSPTALRSTLAAAGARVRLRSQFSIAFVLRVLRLVAPGTEAALDPWSRDAAAGRDPAVVAFVARVCDEAMTTPAPERGGGRAVVRRAWVSVSAWVREDASLVATLERHWPGVTDTTDRDALAHEGPDAPGTAAPGRAAEPPVPVEDVDDELDGILVANAGIVLLHPFIHQCLEGAGLADADGLLHPDRALCLLHYLATGERTAPEYALVLPKVLCGMELDEHARADVGLTDAETDEADTMLTAAITHWGALRGSGPDAVRAEFLTRSGRLARAADGEWDLTVEPRSVDVLLDQLPWGLSLIRLPWMGAWLRVGWSYS